MARGGQRLAFTVEVTSENDVGSQPRIALGQLRRETVHMGNVRATLNRHHVTRGIVSHQTGKRHLVGLRRSEIKAQPFRQRGIDVVNAAIRQDGKEPGGRVIEIGDECIAIGRRRFPGPACRR